MLGCLGLYPTKNLGTLGDDGAIFTDDVDMPERVNVENNFAGHLFVVCSLKGDGLSKHLKQHHVMSEVHYPNPDYRQLAIGHR